MQYLIKLIQLSTEKAIYIPDYKQVKKIYTSLLELEPATPFPYWAKVWPSAIALLKILQKHPNWIKDKNVLELGAGILLPSLMMAGITRSIQISDYNLDAVALLQKNIKHLELENTEALQLDWNALPEAIHTEVLILSDINYDPTQFEALKNIIEKFIHQGSTVILSTPQRIMASPFVNSISAFIIADYVELVDENGIPKEISILVLSKTLV